MTNTHTQSDVIGAVCWFLFCHQHTLVVTIETRCTTCKQSLNSWTKRANFFLTASTFQMLSKGLSQTNVCLCWFIGISFNNNFSITIEYIYSFLFCRWYCELERLSLVISFA